MKEEAEKVKKHTIKTVFKDMIKEYRNDKKHYNTKIINLIFNFLKNSFKYLIKYIGFLIVIISVLSVFIYSLKDKSLVDLEKLKTGICIFFGVGIFLFYTLNMFCEVMTVFMIFDDVYSSENKRRLKKGFEKFFAGMIFYIYSEKIIFLIFEIFKIY
ncbi:hypothetical protein [Parvimonas parva]|uniref:Uncharacterized protein n=1 Tax=Parvimonas parva TaxID=2769485 RepID=A0ABS1C960_9FIRM|nr:hypothetical protein [Parvimonas parva]MBK1468657.1 hypothetical protein [Parvimonas parva]